MPDVYTRDILLNNQSEEIGENQRSFLILDEANLAFNIRSSSPLHIQIINQMCQPFYTQSR